MLSAWPSADQTGPLADGGGHLQQSGVAGGRDCRQPPRAAAHKAALRHLLAILILHLAYAGLPDHPEVAGPGDTFVRFREAVERDFTRTRRLADYARELGYSPRTLSRATQAAVGITAKEFIDRRVILEARRLLAYGDCTAAQVARDLGFASATNFSKFFRQRSGSAPLAFRAAAGGHLHVADGRDPTHA